MPDTIVAPSTPAPAASTAPVTAAPAPAPAAPPTPTTESVPAQPLSIADASKQFLSSLTPEQQTQQLGDPVPATTPEAAAQDDAATLAFDQPTWNESAQRWQNPDGTFAAAPEGATPPAPADAAQTDPAVADPNAPPADAPPEPIVVSVKGRDGTPVEIAVDDPVVADLIRANANDGMRRDEFNRRIESVESKEIQFKEFETMLQTNPEYVFAQLPEAAQQRLAETIIAQHWDAIVNRISQMDQDPTYRVTVAAEAKVRQHDLKAQMDQKIQAQRHAAKLEQAVRSLIPESVDQETVNQFLTDAATTLGPVLQTRVIDPSEIPQLLASRIALYRFQSDQADPAQATPAVQPSTVPASRVPVRATAAPSNGVRPAQPIAQPADPAAAAQATTQRMKATQQARAAASAVAPAGAGATPVRVQVPEHATIEEASAYVRKSLGNRW